MQSSKTTTLAPILLLLAIGTAPQYSLASIDGDTLRTMAEALPMEVEIRGRFLFAPVPVSGIASDVFVCEVDHAQSGGRFCFATTNETFHILEAKDGGIMDIFQVLKDEWYVLSESDGTSMFSTVSFRRWHDGTDEAGLNAISGISVYRLEDGMISAETPSSLPGLVCSPDFSSLERPDWFWARRSGTNEWAATIVSNRTDNESCFAEDPLLGDPTIRVDSQRMTVRKAAGFGTSADCEVDFRSALSARLSTAFPITTSVVLESGGGENQPFVLVSAGENENEDGELWSAYLWDGERWAQSPPDGFKCASGRCPASFRARADAFYRLTLEGEPPRLIVLQNRNGHVRELFWEEALGSKIELLNFQKGLPCKGYEEAFGLPVAPRSFLQSLEAGSPFRRLERVLPVPLSP